MRHLLGLDEIYRVGGAHAIAAMAFGTATIARVDRIVGPGNAYVAAAKKLLAGVVGIDFVAGPTEIMILAAEGDARVIAADMLAQAEHDVTASAVLVTTSQNLAAAVSAQLEDQLCTLPTAAVARQAIDANSHIYVVPTMQTAAEISTPGPPNISVCMIRRCCRSSGTRALSFWVRTRLSRPATMRRAPVMSFPPEARLACGAVCRLPISSK